MEYRTIKHQSDAALENVKVEFDTEQGNIAAVRITDAAGKILVIKRGTSYSDHVVVLSPELFTYEDAILVSADLPANVKIREIVADPEAARRRCAEIDREFFSGMPHAGHSNIKRKIDRDGKALGYVTIDNKLIDDDIPF